MKVRDLMSTPPETCQPHSDLATVTRLMWDRDCGVIPVVDATGRVVGVVTDRDICVAAATRRLPPEHIAASQVMSSHLHTCLPDDKVEQALATMKQARVRRLPVIDAHGRLTGIVSINDVVRAVGKRGGPTASALIDTLASICAPAAPSLVVA